METWPCKRCGQEMSGAYDVDLRTGGLVPYRLCLNCHLDLVLDEDATHLDRQYLEQGLFDAGVEHLGS